MKKFKTIDYTGATSIHFADSKEEAEQRHLVHFGLIMGLLDGGFVSVEETIEPACEEKYCNFQYHSTIPPRQKDEH